MRWTLAFLALVAQVLAVPVAHAEAPYCQSGQAVAFWPSLAALAAQLPAMGQPLECQHTNPDNGDVMQQTSAGLAFFRAATGLPTFTNGFEHWALTAYGLAYWTGDSNEPPAPVVAPTLPSNDVISRVIQLTTMERQKAGLASLANQASLQQAAAAYASVLASSGCFAHTCGPVPAFTRRAENAGYAGWTALAENLAAGQRTAEDVVAAWMSSPGHRANILNASLREIGAGEVTGGPMGNYWVQLFGARP